MLSPDAARRLAKRYFENRTAAGIDMSQWKILLSRPEKLMPRNLVLLAEHTGDDIGTIINHGIGVANELWDLQQVLVIDRHGVRVRPVIELAEQAA